MFWDIADTGTYLRWLQAAQLIPTRNRYIPEGDSGMASYSLRHPRAGPSAIARVASTHGESKSSYSSGSALGWAPGAT